MIQIKKDAPIIPFEGLGGIKLYSSIYDLREILSSDSVVSSVINGDWIRYDVQRCVELFFHMKNKKLFRITTLEEYSGKLFGGISVGTAEKEMLKIEPSFTYDDFEEVWECPKGVFIEMDAATNTVKWISVYIKELDADDFDEAQW